MIFRYLTFSAVLVVTCAFATPTTTTKESPWPARYKTIVIGTTVGHARMPFEQIDTNGNLVGFSPDYLHALLKFKNNTKIKLQTRIYPDFPALLKAVCDGQVDLVTSIDTSPQREKCLSFSQAYLQDDAAILGRRTDREFADNSQLGRAKIGYYRGSVYEKILRDRYPHSKLIPLNFPQVIDAIESGKVDVFFGTTLVLNYLLQSKKASNLEIIRYLPGTPVRLHFAASKTNKRLIQLLDERQTSLPSSVSESIASRWFETRLGVTVPTTGAEVFLNPQEQAYLRSLPILRLGYGATWMPLTFVGSDGEIGGIASDYIHYLNRVLGVRFERSPQREWVSILKSFEKNDIDILIGSKTGTPESPTLRYSIPMDSYPLVLVLRQSASPVTNRQGMSGKKVGVLNGKINGEPASEFFPGAQIVSIPVDVNGFDDVVSGKLDAYVANLVVADSAISSNYVGQLKTDRPIEQQQEIVFLAHDNLEPLILLIDRALKAMPESEQARIRNKWLAARYNYGVSWGTVASRLWPFVISALLVLLVTIYAYLKLKREVHRRASIEEALEAQLSFQQTLMETVPYPILAKDENKRFISINRAAEEMFGLSRDQLLGRSAEDVSDVAPALQDVFGSVPGTSLMNGIRKDSELSYVGSDQLPRVAQYRLAVFGSKNTSGNGGIIAALVDLTDMRRAQAREEALARRLSDLTRNLPAVVFQALMTTDGVLSFPFVGGNAELLFGVTAEEMMASEAAAMRQIVLDDQAALMATIMESAATLEPARVEFRTNVGDRILWLRGVAMPASQPDGSVLWSGYWTDTSAERAREDALREANDLAQRASRAKDEFLAVMSHEIRTPLSGVVGLVEVLNQTVLYDEQAAMLNMIQDSAGALRQILDDILDYSKIEAGQLSFESLPFDVRDTCDLAMGLLAPKAHEKGIRLRLHVAAAVAKCLRGDSVRIRQILFNLLSNAIKFTAEGTVSMRVDVGIPSSNAISELGVAHEQREHIEPTAHLIESVSPTTQTIVITVEDTGIGIPSEIQPMLFAAFVQADSTTSRRFGGTGLGLTICNLLTKGMNGTLQLHSQVGMGTRVTLRLNLPVEASKLGDEMLAGTSFLVLLQDSEETHSVVDGLTSLGIEPTVMNPSSATSEELLQLPEVDAVFLDSGVEPPVELGDVPVIHITEMPESGGYRINNDDIWLSYNPLLWRSLKAACRTAIVGNDRGETGDGIKDGWLRYSMRSEEHTELAGILILVAEDNVVNRILIKRQLNLLGYVCDTFVNGVEAFDAYCNGRYDLLLTDCHMPIMNGYDLTRRIRDHELSAHCERLPIIGITASTEAGELTRCQQAGMDECLIKPTSLELLHKCLLRWLGGAGIQIDMQMGVKGRRHAEPLGGNREGVIFDQSDESPQSIDLATLKEMLGSWSSVGELLDAFIESTETSREKLHDLLRFSDKIALREWHHGFAGSAMVLQYPPLLDRLRSFREQLNHDDIKQVQVAGEALLMWLEEFVRQLSVARESINFPDSQN